MNPAENLLNSFVPRMLRRRLKLAYADSLGPSEEVQPAVLLFVDVSGFTALSERLADLGAIGSERLTEYLNSYFTRILETTLQHGGDVLKLAGDALLVAWPLEGGDAVRQHLRAAHCALSIQAKCHQYEVAPGEYLSVKIGLASGSLRTLIIGGKRGRWEFLPVCPLVEEVGRAESAAHPGQIVAASGFRGALGAAFSGEKLENGLWKLTAAHGRVELEAALPPDDRGEFVQSLKGFIPGAVIGRLGAGNESWLAELRRVSVVFIYLSPGEGVSGSTLPLQAMQEYMEGIQDAVYQFEGSINKWSVDEKGICLLAVFGLPPVSHEDDPLRAVRAAEEMVAWMASRGEQCRIGVASGRAYCGLVGSRVRQEYTIIGFAVNRAARLAQAVSDGILCDLSTKRLSEGHVSFEARPPIRVKGIQGSLDVFSPVRGAPEWDASGAVAGHSRELDRLKMGVEDLRRGQTLVYIVEGEAGIGKSTFLQRWKRHAQAAGLMVVAGSGDGLQRHTPYYTWKPILTDLLRQLGGNTPEERAALIERLLDQENHSRLLAPLLNDILPTGLEDNHVSAQIFGGLRADNTRELVVQLITACAKERPLAIVIEDLHCCDSLSLRLTRAVAEKSNPVLLVAATRPTEPDDAVRELYTSSTAQVIRLGQFTGQECAALICAKLGATAVEPAVADFIFSRSGGSPLFATELSYALCESRRVCVEGGLCVVAAGATLQHHEVPDSLQGVITQRVDRLDTPAQVAVKVASVIGEAFPAGVLKAVYPLKEDADDVDLHLSRLQSSDLIRDERGASADFRFSHSLVHDTVYGLILFSQRKKLHSSIAHHLEQREAPDRKQAAALLGHHWKQSGEVQRAAHHLGVAGELAVREGAYRDALTILNQTLEIGADAFNDGPADPAQRLQRGHWHRMKAEALLGLGQLVQSAGELIAAADLLGCPVPAVVDSGAVLEALGRKIESGSVAAAPAATDAERSQAMELVFCYEVLSILNLFSDNRTACLGAAFVTLLHAERMGDGPDLARALATVSVALAVQPERRLADRYAAAALSMSERIGQEFTTSRVLELLGMRYMGDGHWDKAAAAFSKAIEGFKLVGDQRRRIECTCLSSTFQHYRGNFGRRVVMGMEVLDLARISGDMQAGAWGYLDQIESLISMGEFKAARPIGEKLAGMIGSSIIGCDVIMAHGLLARLEIRQGAVAAAVAAATSALDVIRTSDPTIVYNLEAYAAPAEVFLTLWQRCLQGRLPEAPEGDWAALAPAACIQLRRFAKIFRIAVPRYLLWRGVCLHLEGRPGLARRHLRRSAEVARRLEMPYEEAFAAMHLSFVLPRESPQAGEAAARARELLAALNARYDLACLDAGAW